MPLVCSEDDSSDSAPFDPKKAPPEPQRRSTSSKTSAMSARGSSFFPSVSTIPQLPVASRTSTFHQASLNSKLHDDAQSGICSCVAFGIKTLRSDCSTGSQAYATE